MKVTREDLHRIIKEELNAVLYERCQKGYKTHDTQKTKEMFGKTYRNCVKAEEGQKPIPKKGVYAISKDNIRQVQGIADNYRKSGYVKSADYIDKAIERAKRGEIDYDTLYRSLDVALDMLGEAKKKAGTESSKESSLRDWFGRKGAKGKKKGWVDCNAPDGKGGYKSCGRSSGEKRSKYPSCRPTPGACKERGKGKSWGKKAAKGKK